MSTRSVRAFVAAGSLLAAALTVAGCTTSDARTLPGAELFEACVACHGDQGLGDPTLGAPRIAGLPEWYVTAQLQRFQTGLRGEHPDDYEGLRMRAMARQMLTGEEVAAVAGHVATLPVVVNPATRTDGDPEAGQITYATCVPCHGMSGEGNQAVGAPAIAGLDDWYMERQLEKFQAGVRGTAPGDVVGPTMRAMSLTLQPESIRNVVAYVHGLEPQP